MEESVESEASESFVSDPSFEMTSFALMKQKPIPDNAVDVWNSITIEGNIILISKVKNRGYIYMFAKDRYLRLKPFMSNEWPLSYLILAEALFWLSSYHESLRLLQLLQTQLAPDSELNRIIACIRKLIEIEENEVYYHHKKASQFTCEFSTPFECPFVSNNEQGMQEIEAKWKRLKDKEEAADMLFIRHACISTNVIENVFELEGNSWPRLIRRGFHTNSIEGIAKTSKTKKKEAVINILKDTQECFQCISRCLDDITTFNIAFLKEVHSTLLKNDNFESYEQDEGSYEVIRLITTGQFRKVACITTHNDETEVTQYCHHSQIANEMDNYCKHAQILLNDNKIDPFIKCAWLQWAFLRIHPFEDGNGRVSRIISSIPLYKLNLPPIVVVSIKDKHEYFAALHEADRKSNLNPLAEFLRNSLLKAISEIEQLPKDNALTLVTTKAYRKKVPGFRFPPERNPMILPSNKK